jgi:hypothetical protein
MTKALSSRMVRMLKWVKVNGTDKDELKKANQITLRGLAIRGLLNTNGVTSYGENLIDQYDSAEFISRKAQDKDLSDGVKKALKLVKYRALRKK